MWNYHLQHLCNSILLGTVANGMLVLNPRCITEITKFLGHVLSSLVITKTLDKQIKVILCPSFEQLESSKSLTFASEQIHNPQSGAVINEHDPVAESRVCADTDWSMNISVDEFKWCSSTMV